jgi:hypothetical protein
MRDAPYNSRHPAYRGSKRLEQAYHLLVEAGELDPVAWRMIQRKLDSITGIMGQIEQLRAGKGGKP